jgi:hypothetical protein
MCVLMMVHLLLPNLPALLKKLAPRRDSVPQPPTNSPGISSSAPPPLPQDAGSRRPPSFGTNALQSMRKRPPPPPKRPSVNPTTGLQASAVELTSRISLSEAPVPELSGNLAGTEILQQSHSTSQSILSSSLSSPSSSSTTVVGGEPGISAVPVGDEEDAGAPAATVEEAVLEGSSLYSGRRQKDETNGMAMSMPRPNTTPPRTPSSAGEAVSKMRSQIRSLSHAC